MATDSLRDVEEFPMTQCGKIVRRAVANACTGEDVGELSSIENSDAIAEIAAAR